MVRDPPYNDHPKDRRSKKSGRIKEKRCSLMASVTFALPDNVKAEMKRLSWINWSELARLEILERLKQEQEIEEFRRIVSKSKLTEKQAQKLAEEVNRSLAKRYEKLSKRRGT